MIFQEKEFWLLILLGIIHFYRPLFLGETFFFRDLYLHTVADKQPLLNSISRGELPLWNPYLLGGQPYLGNIASSVWYPTNLLFFVFPPVRAFNVNIVLHFLLSLGSAYTLARVLSFVPLTSFLVGVMYSFSGVTLSSTNLPGIWFDLPYFPLLLLFWHLFLSERKRRWFLLSVLLGALQALAYSPEPNAIIMIFLLGWTLCYPYPKQSLVRRSVLWMLLGVFSVGLALIIILPTAEIVLHSGRQQSIEQATKYSLHPKRLFELVFPAFLGNVNAIRPRFRYWGWKLTKEALPFFLNIYWGWIALFLAAGGSVWKDSTKSLHFPRKSRVFCTLFAAACLLIAFGDYWPFFQEFYLKLPFHSLFASPVKLLIGMLLPIALLAGYASERCFCQEKVSSRILSMAWGLTVSLGVVSVYFHLSDKGTVQFIRKFFESPVAEQLAIEGVKRSLVHVTVLFMAFALLLTYRRLAEKRWHFHALAGLVIVDLLVAGQAVNFYAPEDFFTDIPDIVSLVRNEIGDGRFFHTKNPSDFSLLAPSDELMWLSRWNLEVLSSYTAYHYKIPVIFYRDPNNLGQAQIVHLRHLLQKLPWSQKIPILSAGAVSLLMNSSPLHSPDLELIAEIPNRSSLRMFLYRNLRAAKRVEFVTDWAKASSDEEALARLSAPSFDPRRQVILQDHGAESISPADFKISSEASEAANIRKIFSSSHSAKFSVKSERAGCLVFSEPYYPGWHISINGEEVPILRANYAYSAIFLPEGEHEVARWYRPDMLLFGMFGSFVSLGLLLLLVYKGRHWLE